MLILSLTYIILKDSSCSQGCGGAMSWWALQKSTASKDGRIDRRGSSWAHNCEATSGQCELVLVARLTGGGEGGSRARSTVLCWDWRPERPCHRRAFQLLHGKTCIEWGRPLLVYRSADELRNAELSVGCRLVFPCKLTPEGMQWLHQYICLKACCHFVAYEFL